MRVKVLIQRRHGPTAYLGVTSLFVLPQPLARGLVQLRQEIERNIRGLIIFRIRTRDVMH
jgi:hypothetical protein